MSSTDPRTLPHPQVRALLDRIAASNTPATHTLSPQAARQAFLDRARLTQPRPPEIGACTDLTAPGPGGPIRLRHYRPVEQADPIAACPALVYFHGGGWVIGDLNTHDTLCRQLANASGCAVVAVDYRMGPEHPFPAAVEDCIAACRFVSTNASLLCIDPHRIAVGGDSAGGNLAAVVAIAARDDAMPNIAFQLLIYPATDMRRQSGSYTSNGEGYLLTRDTMRYYHDHYIHDASQDLDWRASPLLAPDLGRLPPALVITAGFDPLRDEGLAYADRLSDAGVTCSYVCFERQIHGFITMGAVLDEANDAVLFAASALKRSLQHLSSPI